MARNLVIEEYETTLPPFLIVDTSSGFRNKLLDLLSLSFEKKMKVYALTKKRAGANVNVISPLSIHVINKISDLKYVTIFLDEEAQKKKVAEIVDKLSVHNARILVLIPYRVSERFIDIIINLKDIKNLTIGLIGDLFGELHQSSPLSKIISNAIESKKVVISGNELMPIFPISETDLVSSIHNILFSKKHTVLSSLFYEHPQTILSLTHLLKRIEPELSIYFKEGKENIVGQENQEQKDRYIHDRVGVYPAKIENLDGFERSVEKMQGKTPQPNQRSRTSQQREKIKKHAGNIGRVFKYLIYGFTLYLLISFTLFFISLLMFKLSVSSALSGDIKSSSQHIKLSKKLFDFSKSTAGAVVGVPRLFSNTYLLDYLSIYEKVLGDVPILLETIERADAKTLDKKHLEKSLASLFELYFVTQRYNLAEFYEVLKAEKEKNFSKFIPIINVFPQVLGFDSAKNYVLLFQNSNELRPTGGFIGSASYVTVKVGKVDEMKINDIYELDGQLKGHVEPHFIIRRYLQPHLYLRDSNFSPDFEQSASMSAFLYSLETGKKVDGVIAIDTQVLKDLIRITGPFNISGVGKVSPSNVVNLVQDSVKDNFFPGSTNKKDILNTILNKIIIAIEDPKKRAEVFKILPKLILEKHILFAFSDNSINRAFSAAGFTSNLTDNRIGKNLLGDALGVNEANIGVNKANEFLERKVNYSAYLNGDKLDSEITLTYENNGGEDYRAYLRVIIPKTSELSLISIDGVNQEIVPAVTDFKVYERKNFEPPTGLEVDEDIHDGKKTIGFIINITKNESARIKINLENSSIIPTAGSFDYSLLYFKQPGTNTYPLTVSLQGDSSYKIQAKSPVIFDSNIKSDEEFKKKVLRKNPQ